MITTDQPQLNEFNRHTNAENMKLLSEQPPMSSAEIVAQVKKLAAASKWQKNKMPTLEHPRLPRSRDTEFHGDGTPMRVLIGNDARK